MGFARGEVYPSWRQTADGKTCLVHDKAEDDALGAEWDVPEAFAQPVADDVPAEDAPKKKGRPRKDAPEA